VRYDRCTLVNVAGEVANEHYEAGWECKPKQFGYDMRLIDGVVHDGKVQAVNVADGASCVLQTMDCYKLKTRPIGKNYGPQ